MTHSTDVKVKNIASHTITMHKTSVKNDSFYKNCRTFKKKLIKGNIAFDNYAAKSVRIADIHSIPYIGFPESHSRKGKINAVKAGRLFGEVTMTLYTRGKNKIYWTRIWDPKEKDYIRRSCKTRNKREAEKFERNLIKDLERNEIREGYVCFSEAISAYVEDKLPLLRPATQRNYLRYIRHMSEFFKGGYCVQDIDAKAGTEFRDYLAKIRETPVKEREISLTLQCLSAFISYCVERHIISFNPVLGKALKKTQARRRKREFNAVEQKKLINNAQGSMLTFVLLCLDAGLRHSEALKLQRTHVNFDNKTVTVIMENAKNGKERIVPMTFRLHAQLHTQIIKNSCLNQWVFSSPSRDGPMRYRYTAWRTLVRRCDIDNAHIHDLRRTYGGNLRENGIAMHTISTLLGHSNTQVTESVYAHARLSELSAAVKTLDTATCTNSAHRPIGSIGGVPCE